MEELITRYIEILKSKGDEGEIYKCEAINHFQDHWDIEAEDFKEMFTIALQHTGNLLYHNSRSYILTLVEHFPEEVRLMYRHLYNEEIPLEERISAFRKTANDLLPKVKKAINSDNLATHQDERSTSVYLAFRFPEKYYLYKASFYRKLCERLDIPVKKARKRLLHYLELAEKIKDKYITNNTELQELSSQIYPETKWDDDNLLTQNFLYNMLDSKTFQNKSMEADSNVAGVKEFHAIVHSHNKQYVLDYFEYLDRIIAYFDLKKDDPRVFTTTVSNRLNLTLGKRYSWNLYPTNSSKGKFRLI